MPTVTSRGADANMAARDKINDDDVEYVKESAVEGLVDEMAEAIKALLVMSERSKPRKLDEALTWRANDEKAHQMARTALAHHKELN